MRALTAVILSLATLGILVSTAEAAGYPGYHRCLGTYVDPAGGLGYTDIRAIRVPCRIARSVTRRYVSDLGPKGHPRVMVVFDSNGRRWRCERYERGSGDGNRYLQIVCRATGLRRVRFRGYS